MVSLTSGDVVRACHNVEQLDISDIINETKRLFNIRGNIPSLICDEETNIAHSWINECSRSWVSQQLDQYV